MREEADLAWASDRHFERRLKEARIVVEQFALAGPCYAGVSWGKDSVVLAWLLWECARDVPLVHLRPTNHNDECDLVRDAFFSRHIGQAYCELPVDYSAVDRNRPDDEVDRATNRQWYAAIAEAERRFGARKLLGIRADESSGRALRVWRHGLATARSCSPLGYWSARDVFAALARYELPVHPAYACTGGGRWRRERLRVADLGDTRGTGRGRREWEREYYGDVLARLDHAR